MPLDPKVNAENPPKAGRRNVVVPSGFAHVPGVHVQPMIDPVTGKVITAEGPQNTNPAPQAAPATPAPSPAPTPGPGVPHK